MQIEAADLPEFGLSVSWAMCRNPMCANFGIPFEGEIAKDRRQASDERYTIRVIPDTRGRPVGEIRCRYCGQSSRLASNKAIRPIARYFLSLSLPFADCPNTDCANHGVNLFEHWGDAGSYRQVSEHTAACDRCGTSIGLGTARRVRNDRRTKAVWRNVLQGMRSGISIADAEDIWEIDRGKYRRSLVRIGARLRDYHAFRNAHLLRADVVPDRDKPIGLYTGILDVSLRTLPKDRRTANLKVIVSAALVDRTTYVLAAHPCFLPERFCPDYEVLARDWERLDFETGWGCVSHPFTSDPALGPDVEALRDVGRGGYFIRSPYAELAHFLVVQKMLARFGAIHAYMDSAKDIVNAASVAFRDRILAGRPDADGPADKRGHPPAHAEIVLLQHDRSAPYGKRETGKHRASGKDLLLDTAWRAVEKRFEEQALPPNLPSGKTAKKDPQVRARMFRHALRGAYSAMGGWAWLHYPPPSRAYSRPRSLWLTRMPGKTFETHGKPVLANATPAPVDSVFNTIRARIPSAGRRFPPAAGRSFRWNNHAMPDIVLAELSVHLLRRNYAPRRQPGLERRIPAETMGLVPAGAAKLDLLKRAWGFRLGLAHAKRMSAWRRR